MYSYSEVVRQETQRVPSEGVSMTHERDSRATRKAQMSVIHDLEIDPQGRNCGVFFNFCVFLSL